MKLFDILICMVVGAITIMVSLAMLVTAEHMHDVPLQLISITLVILGGIMFFVTPVISMK